MSDIEALKRKLKKRRNLPGYGANTAELEAAIDRAARKPPAVEPIEEPEEAIDEEPQTPAAAVTSPDIASEAAALMHHEDPAVRRVAASAMRQAGRRE